ncbi:MAG: amidohydrolase [Clostridia bacterium]|nr:amidohydrolase [Clostridia bacterium]
MTLIDSHVHLWLQQTGTVGGRPVRSLTGGRSDFGGEIRQMTPPYMVDGANTAEMLISNMDYAGVSTAVVTQEVIDGDQNEYLRAVKAKYPDRIKICSYFDDDTPPETEGFDGIKLCACRMKYADLTKYAAVFEAAQKHGLFIGLELADGDAQTASAREMIRQFPDVRIAIGHFGMVTRPGWQEQIRLAREKNVVIESGGITWLFHKEFYPYPSAVRAIREAAQICGMEKLLWGSDYPRTMSEITYKMSFDFVLKSTELTEKEKAAFLSENAARFFGFDRLYQCEPVKNMLED